YQKEILDKGLYTNLSVARKSRNSLSHTGKSPSEDCALAAYSALMELIQLAAPDCDIPLLRMDIRDHLISDPFVPRQNKKINPTHWMEIPKLPGEEELEKLEIKNRKSS